LCSVWELHHRQNFLYTSRSGCFCLFFDTV
jgi:hypothetical protein